MKSTQVLHGHWNTLIDNFNCSSKEFYTQLSAELKSKGIRNVYIRQKTIRTGSVFSTRRLYLRITWKGYTYDCCCAPFASGTFFSWWLFSEKTGLNALFCRIPFIGEYLSSFFFPDTYYKSDTASMFMTYTQSAMQNMIESITTNKGIRGLSEMEKKPVMRDIFKR